MGEISDKARSAFSDANRTVGLDFTSNEQVRIAQITEELKRIMDAEKKRLQEKLGGKR